MKYNEPKQEKDVNKIIDEFKDPRDPAEFLDTNSRQQLNWCLNALFARAYTMINGEAKAKGYRGLYRITGRDHAMGEIHYKIARYKKLGDPEDLIKIIGWITLLHRDDVREYMGEC